MKFKDGDKFYFWWYGGIRSDKWNGNIDWLRGGKAYASHEEARADRNPSYYHGLLFVVDLGEEGFENFYNEISVHKDLVSAKRSYISRCPESVNFGMIKEIDQQKGVVAVHIPYFDKNGKPKYIWTRESNY